ncbi:PTS sugar transporter subunit IIC [Myxococcota bacterium]|nr:PTS sugar transporter subunit IIC [Myxococcota bacterium]MBU1432957.1 PTS sugar transporter subunit IIC [Myxococcota bacterium]MBU1896311.1 PTS sugar transporter subunit IIC [Myxococcota bacterium]
MNATELAWDAMGIALAGGVISLDRRSALQLMISQPLVAVPLLGLLFSPDGGQSLLWLAAIIQLLFLGSVLFGTTVPSNETIAGLAAAGGVIFFQRLEPSAQASAPEVWVPALLMGLAVGEAGRAIEIRLDRQNVKLSQRAEEAAARHDTRALSLIPWSALLWLFSLNTLLLGLSALLIALILVLITPLYAESPSLSYTVNTLAYYILPALGCGVALTMLRERKPFALAALLFIGLGFWEGLQR